MENFKLTEDEIQEFLDDKETKENIMIIAHDTTDEDLVIYAMEHYSRHDQHIRIFVNLNRVCEWLIDKRRQDAARREQVYTKTS